MRVSRICGFLLIAFLTVGFIACNNTVSSKDASDDELDYIPGFYPVKNDSSQTDSSKTDVTSSSSEDSASVPESSAAEETCAALDLSETKVQVDTASCVAVITDDFLGDVGDDVASELDSLKQAFDYNEETPNFVESGKIRFAVDDLNFAQGHYYCFTVSRDWLEISKEKLLETGLPFLWGGSAFESREGFLLSFETPCGSIFIKKN